MEENFEEYKVQLGRRVKSARVLKGVTQMQLHATTGLPHHTITGIETGKGNPKIKTLYLISKALECDSVIV